MWFTRRNLSRLGRDLYLHNDDALSDSEPEEDLTVEDTNAPLSTAINEPRAIVSLNFHKQENHKEHHTSDYDIPNLIVRRGQPFKLTVTLNSKLLEDEYIVLRFTATIAGCRGHGPSQKKVLLSHDGITRNNDWSMNILNSGNEVLNLEIMPPSNAIVARYKVSVCVKSKDERSKWFTPAEKMYVLFNPWCRRDGVYMPKQILLDEYLLNESGVIFVGSSDRYSPRSWNFGQFDSPALEVAMDLLDCGLMSAEARQTPIYVSRHISALTNCSDEDNGILTGRWTDDYPAGTSPSRWTGSIEILQKYHETKKPVQFGQCWVFSGLVTTILRALGIPCRSVTNFDSAHDTDVNMTLDVYVDEDMKPIRSGDSCWNFHVWNECWFRRPDLPPGYDGWQALDATPQEASDGIYRAGPCPVSAIKDGSVYLCYDGRFIFAEVNADRVIWQRKKGEWTPIRIDRDHVGTRILTKAVGENEGDNLTLDYKQSEGSFDEAVAKRKAVRFGTNPDFYKSKEPVTEDIEHSPIKFNEVILASQDFDVSGHLMFYNMSTESRRIYGRLTVELLQYTGCNLDLLMQEIVDITIPGSDERKYDFEVKFKNQLLNMKDERRLRILFTLFVPETHQVLIINRTCPIILPTVTIEAKNTDVSVGESVEIRLLVANPYKTRLTMCDFTIEGPGLEKAKTLPIENVKRNQYAVASTFIVPRRSGKRKLIATFNCRQFQGAIGELMFSVK